MAKLSTGDFGIISIHALLAESDGDWLDTWDSGDISIHALLAESDQMPTITGIMYSDNFYPRSPCGERPALRQQGRSQKIFLSTLSLRRATLRKVPLLGIK